MEGVNAVIAAAENKFQQLKLHSRAGLEIAFENHTTFEVDIGIDAPIIYVPERLVIDLHNKSLRNWPSYLFL